MASGGPVLVPGGRGQEVTSPQPQSDLCGQEWPHKEQGVSAVWSRALLQQSRALCQMDSGATGGRVCLQYRPCASAFN